MKISNEHLRPGGTVSGPTMFLLADVSFYLATLNIIGPKSLTVTTNCSINFLRKPNEKNLISKTRNFKIPPRPKTTALHPGKLKLVLEYNLMYYIYFIEN